MTQKQPEKTMAINGLEVTHATIFPVKNKRENSSLVAFARVILNNQFTINVRVFEDKEGLFVHFYDNISADLKVNMIDHVVGEYKAVKYETIKN